MAKVTSEEFLSCVEKSRLVESGALEGFRATLQQQYGNSLPEDPVEIAKQFESAGLLTRWHCEKLLQGRYKGFFLGKHKLLGHLGTGGMSTVYLAEHVMMHSKRAIKVLPKSKLGNNSYLQRFHQEAKAVASLNHPNIVRAYDIDNDGDTHYLVMEYVEGSDLQTLVRKKGPVDYDQAANYIAQAARGLQHAHEMGLIHRDVKPANLFINRDGMIKVLDLGLALFADESQASVTMEHNDKVLGTADYLAPEQAINSHNIDARADIYGLGCSLYFLLTGHPPFPQGSIATRIAKHQSTMPEDIRKDRPDCPGELDGICVKMMQKDPRFRYPDCAAVADVLEAWMVNYRKSQKSVKPKVPTGVPVTDSGEGSKSSLGSGLVIGNPRDNETVSNRSGDTIGGSLSSRSGSLVSLSASDSGTLRAIALNGGSDIGSRIDLENDTNRPNPHRDDRKPPNAPPQVQSNNPRQNKAIPLPKSSPTKPAGRTSLSPKSAPSRPVRNAEPKKTSLNLVLAGVIAVVVVISALVLTWLFS
jgi:eukaryotic-like serine/threonine-protein kinase